MLSELETASLSLRATLRARHRMSDVQPNTDSLLPRVARGDAEAVQACIARYGSLVWSLARRMSRDVAGLEDLVQEIFIDIWKSADRFDPSQSSETSFIATIARRRVIDQHRRTARAQKLETIDESSAVAEEPGFAQVDLGDEARRANAALDQLRPEQRRVILMSVVDGLTHAEIVTATGFPLGTVKSHIRRGLEETVRLLRPTAGGEQP